MKNQSSEVNKRIKRYRVLAGYTQETAALELGMDPRRYSYLERCGKPSPEQLLKISELYNVSVSEIFYGKVDTTPIKQPDTLFEPITPEPPQRIAQPEPTFLKGEPPLTLTANEKGLIKVLRQFSAEDRKRVYDLINEIRKSNK